MEAARSINIAFTHDGFDTAMFELRSNDWKQFIEQLGKYYN
jgi:hypothetical protein